MLCSWGVPFWLRVLFALAWCLLRVCVVGGGVRVSCRVGVTGVGRLLPSTLSLEVVVVLALLWCGVLCRGWLSVVWVWSVAFACAGVSHLAVYPCVLWPSPLLPHQLFWWLFSVCVVLDVGCGWGLVVPSSVS